MISNKIKHTGQRFGRLLVLRASPKRGHNGIMRWICLCDCGCDTVVDGSSLRRGLSKSCGCLQREAAKRIVHGHSRYRNTTKTYQTWSNMIQRCTNSKHNKYRFYGGRGIKVCRRWLKFENFLADMGPRPAGKTIDRYPDNDGDYRPDNCRWATWDEQVRNKRIDYGADHPSARLSWEHVEIIRQRRRTGEFLRSIAEEFHVSRQTISDVVNNKRYVRSRSSFIGGSTNV
jgi:CENP-B N-terminal DNA-binding domain